MHDLIGVCRVSLTDLDPTNGNTEHELFTSLRGHGSAGVIEVIRFEHSGGFIDRQNSVNRRDTMIS